MRTKWLSLGLILGGAGCTSMQAVQPAQVIPAQHPALVLVYTADGDAAAVHNPQIDGDTLRGVDGTGTPYSAALKDITKLKARQPSTSKTLWLTGVGVGVGAFTIYELVNQGSSPQQFQCQGGLAVQSECQVPYYP